MALAQLKSMVLGSIVSVDVLIAQTQLKYQADIILALKYWPVESKMLGEKLTI